MTYADRWAVSEWRLGTQSISLCSAAAVAFVYNRIWDRQYELAVVHRSHGQRDPPLAIIVSDESKAGEVSILCIHLSTHRHYVIPPECAEQPVPDDRSQRYYDHVNEMLASIANTLCGRPCNFNTRCSRRRQTSHPVPPPGELDETYRERTSIITKCCT